MSGVVSSKTKLAVKLDVPLIFMDMVCATESTKPDQAEKTPVPCPS